MAFVSDGASQGATAAWLLATAEEAGINIRLIHVTRGGFNIPEELVPFLDGTRAGVQPPIEPEIDEAPPEAWNEPLPTPAVEFTADGRVVLTEEATAEEIANGSVVVEPDPAEVRAWARERGLDVADKGALKRSLVDAFLAARE